MKAPAFAAALVLGALTAVGLSGCATEAFCFNDCNPDTTDAAGGSAGNAASGGTGAINTDGGGGTIGGTGGSPADQCVETNAGVEICDDIDNDCDGKVDNLADWTTVKACGSCDLRCDSCPTDGTPCTIPQFVADPTCQPPGVLDGTTKGTCTWTQCADDYWDIDGNPANGCEYFCQYNPTRDPNKVDIGGTFPGETKGCFFDDDCDGVKDEDVNLCNDVDNCGDCGNKCVLFNATSKCVTTATGTEPCIGSGTGKNTSCEVDQCDAGWHNADGLSANGCEYQCTITNGGVEICDGLDNDCDSNIDNTDPDIEASEVGDPCWGGDNNQPVTQSQAKGVCADASHEGVRKCIGDQIQCCDLGSNTLASTNPQLPPTGLRNGICRATTGNLVVFPGDLLEKCNNLDDDCDGTKDDSPTDVGGTCGSSVGACSAGTYICDSATRPSCTGTDCLKCNGNVAPVKETCNGADDDCDGVTDGTVVLVNGLPDQCTADTECTGGAKCMARATLSDKVCAMPTDDVGGACDVPNPLHPPPGTPVVCTAGTLQCVAGAKTCVGSVTRSISTPDSCGVDENCDGVLSGQPNFQTDVEHCGSCTNNCLAIAPAGHGQWLCSAGVCQRTGCDAGFIDCTGKGGDADPNTCERACTFLSAAESCNGVDDNCDCRVDEASAMTVPSSTQVCGVSPAATDPNCTTNVAVTCVNGGWSCAFPSGYCSGTAPNYCSTQDLCDNKDNNCNGAVDELYKSNASLGQPCSTPSTDGACQGTGVFVCNSTQDGTVCNAVKKNCTDLAGGCTELCDNVDNDCDGSVDEPYTAKGANPSFWVKPAVSQIGTTYIYQYEASRPGATATNPGSGNGFQTSAPSGTTLDKTAACSVPSVVPWFNVTATEVEQTCTARGGRICNLSDWQTACHANNSCTWGYAPLANCSLPGTYGNSNDRICNIGLFDFDGNPVNGIQNGLLPTKSASLFNCWADWPTDIFDITGNLREITKSGTNYTLMGGAYNTQSESGATCDFTFFTVNATYKLFDVGFRCCFDTNPS